MKQLFCIEHEGMVDAEFGKVFGHIVKPLVYPPDWEIDFCEFPSGWATCPPPPFDIDEYIKKNGEPPAIIESDFLPYTYDVDRDEIVQEVLI